MKYYEKLLEMGCFSRADLIELTGSSTAAVDLVYSYQKRGYIERVKRNLYVAISLETRQPLLSRYQIGSCLFPDACISHHSAFEIYGYGSQVFYECYVATKSCFVDFNYNGVIYHRVEKKENLEEIKNGRITYTSLEQTVVDSIRDYEKIAGLEEVVRCFMLIPGLNEDRLKSCLEKNNNGFLYQKCGYLFEQLQDTLHISDLFLEMCRQRSSKAKRYLMKEQAGAVLNAKWRLYTPQSLMQLIDKGVIDYGTV
ncbi:MAG: transcriptional regulator [Clostridium sp.]|nr:transcriptional regulator [Clostridium sp.]